MDRRREVKYLLLTDGRLFVERAGEIREGDDFDQAAALLILEQPTPVDATPLAADSFDAAPPVLRAWMRGPPRLLASVAVWVFGGALLTLIGGAVVGYF